MCSFWRAAQISRMSKNWVEKSKNPEIVNNQKKKLKNYRRSLVIVETNIHQAIKAVKDTK